jgi:hypothetical protein
MASGGTSSLTVVGSQEFAGLVVCPISQLSTLMCVILALKRSLVRMQGWGSITKSSTESRKRHLALSDGCWKAWKIFNFTSNFET